MYGDEAEAPVVRRAGQSKDTGSDTPASLTLDCNPLRARTKVTIWCPVSVTLKQLVKAGDACSGITSEGKVGTAPRAS